MHTDVLVVGGGVAGLNAAMLLHAAGQDVRLVESRKTTGGRVLTRQVNGGAFDLGPAWIWPGQPRIAEVIRQLGLRVFEQYADGEAIFEDAHGRTQRGRGFASMAGSYRLVGGMSALTDALARQLPTDRLHLGQRVIRLSRQGQMLTATTHTDTHFVARRVLLAVPPRLAAQHIDFDPPLPAHVKSDMCGVPTWMAGHAKAVAVYDLPFWRQKGLSGDAISHLGPLAEIHDASPETGGPFALFGFVGMPAETRQDAAWLKTAVAGQLARLFGPDAPAPSEVLIKDWAFDPLTATPEDHKPLMEHPRYGLPDTLKGLWDDLIRFAGTEVADEFGGYLEGALAASQKAVTRVLSR